MTPTTLTPYRYRPDRGQSPERRLWYCCQQDGWRRRVVPSRWYVLPALTGWRARVAVVEALALGIVEWMEVRG
jgi:hypothetical protein